MNADMGTAVRTVIEALDLAAAAERLFGAFRQLLREDPERALRLAGAPPPQPDVHPRSQAVCKRMIKSA